MQTSLNPRSVNEPLVDQAPVFDGLVSADGSNNIHWPRTNEDRRLWLRLSCAEGCEFFYAEIDQGNLNDADLLHGDGTDSFSYNSAQRVPDSSSPGGAR